MPKISSVKVEDSEMNEENMEVLDEVLPSEEEEETSKYPRIYLIAILTLMFVLLSNSMVTNVIVGLTPSFKERPYMATIVQTALFGAGVFILFKSGRFE